MLPIDFFTSGARQFPKRMAALDLATGQCATYQELLEQAFALAHSLQETAGKQRPTVALLTDNSLQMLLGILATYACSGVLVPLTPTVVEQDIARQLQSSQPHLLICDQHYASMVSSYEGPRIIAAGATRQGSNVYSLDQLISNNLGKRPVRPAVEAGEIAAIKFTGGSSGTPKAVLQSFRCINTMVCSMVMMYEFNERERFLLAPPMTHGAGTFVLPVLSKGGCLVISKKMPAHSLHRTLQEQEITATWVPPTLLQKLVLAQQQNTLELSHLSNLLYGGAACPATLLDQAIAAFGPVLGVTYGLTEAPVVIAGMNGRLGSLPENRGSAGRIGPLARVAVLNEFNEPDETPNVMGEVLVSGDLLMLGYMNMPDITAQTMHQGWLRTGDIGRIDDRGYLFIAGRCKDIIISGGFNIYPTDVEEVYLRHPGISECIVFGVADALWGERVEMAVVLHTPHCVTADELTTFGKKNLGSVRTPKTIHVVNHFPKNALGKVDKRSLIAALRQET